MEDLPPRERKQALLDLVSRLTLEEVRELGARLAQVDFRSDIILRLPVELRILVFKHLDARDLQSCFAVSRGWRDAFDSKDALTPLAKKWFPGLVEYAAVTGGSVEALFAEAVRNYYFRSTGKFRSVLHHGLWLGNETYFKLDPAFHAPPVAAKDQEPSPHPYTGILVDPLTDDGYPVAHMVERALYANGRIAWQPTPSRGPDDWIVVIDDLRTRLRKVFRQPGVVLTGGSLNLVALGDRLVVANVARLL
jgi:hypothetical protein